ncbi:hypothetical protein Fmac_015549 [Flemingia macrophylla]|uniref:Uncharacterized protein n=1 Tax=Flemingia macrophylla TaxID=520843 RepID=A0ABD1MEZ2_9FABA
MTQEEKFMDEDVFLDETLLSTNEESLARRLSKWTCPPLHDDYISQSRSILLWRDAWIKELVDDDVMSSPLHFPCDKNYNDHRFP